jgi:hypothetical protein
MTRRPTPPMPKGFKDRSAWDAIHHRFSMNGSLMDQAVINWQTENQDRVKAAIEAQAKAARGY